MTPKLSIVVPLYNKADVVEATLASVAAQRFADYEIIVVDDGSTDGGAERVESLNNDRLRLIRQKNAGVSAARNHGVSEARSDWIALLDADDLWEPDHLDNLYAASRLGPVTCAFSNLTYEKSRRLAVDHAVASQRVGDYFDFALRFGRYAMSSSSVLLDRRSLKAAGMFPVGATMGEDLDTWARLNLQGPFYYVAKATAVYRDGLETSSLSNILSKTASFPLFAQRLPELLRSGAVPEHLARSAKRYANFLLLEYARQLLDLGRCEQAREVLLSECAPYWDKRRYVKRLFRTYGVGQFTFALLHKMVSGEKGRPLLHGGD